MIVEGADKELTKKLTVEETFSRKYNIVINVLKSTIDQKDPTEISLITTILRKIGRNVTEELFIVVVGANDFGQQLVAHFRGFQPELPQATTEEQLGQLIIYALFLFRIQRYDPARQLLRRLLFELPFELVKSDYLEVLSNYLFYKYLIAIERSGLFEQEKSALFFHLKRKQLHKAELLYSTLLDFILRMLTESGNLAEVLPLITHAPFPAKTTPTNQAKYLFYKGHFASLSGKYQEAKSFFEEALLKSPEGHSSRNDTPGYRNFKLLIKKHLICIHLLLSLPIPQSIVPGQTLYLYKKMIRLVTRGQNREFDELVSRNINHFTRDNVMHILNKMKGVVI